MEHGSFTCRHNDCRREKDGTRHTYSSQKALNKHEKSRFNHRCTVEGGCECCNRWQGKCTGPAPAARQLNCRHRGCSHFFKLEQSRGYHELHDEHSCPPECVRCGEKETRVVKKRQWEEAEQKAMEERRQKRKTQTETLRQNITTIPLEQMVEEGLATSEAQHLNTQARALLEVLFEGKSFEQCLLTLLESEPGVIATILQTHSNLQVLQHEPTIDALLAWKDQRYIPDHDWPYTVRMFNLSKRCSITSIRNRREEMNARLLATPTPGGRGSQYSIVALLQWLIQHNPNCLANIKKVLHLILIVNLHIGRASIKSCFVSLDLMVAI